MQKEFLFAWQHFCITYYKQRIMKKSTGLKRTIKAVKRENTSNVPAAKAAPKKEFNDDKNNTLEGYDENEYDGKDKADSKRKKA